MFTFITEGFCLICMLSSYKLKKKKKVKCKKKSNVCSHIFWRKSTLLPFIILSLCAFTFSVPLIISLVPICLHLSVSVCMFMHIFYLFFLCCAHARFAVFVFCSVFCACACVGQ